MNAAFLLVTTAWFAGADPAPAVKPAPAAPAAGAVVSAPYGGAVGTGGCCGGTAYGGCGCGCETDCCKPSCLDRLRARFHRNNCCESCNTGCGGNVGCCGSNYGGNVGCCGSSHGGNVGCCGSNYGGNVGCCGSSHGGNVGCCGSTGGGMTCGCNSSCDSCCKPNLCERLKARFHRNKCCDTGCDTGCGCGCGYGAGYGSTSYGVPGVMPKAEPIKAPKDSKNPPEKLPAGKGSVQSQGLGVTTTSSSNVIETETKNPFELDRRYETRVGRAADYSWVTGQLYYVHADGGLWMLRYAPLWKEDRNGGSVVLARDRQMDSYREGDLVKVHGEILNNQKGAIFLGGPQYRVQSIELIDRAAR